MSRPAGASTLVRSLVAPKAERTGARASSTLGDDAGDEDRLYTRRIVQLWGVLCAYGLVASLLDLVTVRQLDLGDQVMWPRYVALGLVAPLALAGARGVLGPRVLRIAEPLVYLLVIGEVTLEVILSKAPLFAASEPATVMLFLRACFVPSRGRTQAMMGAMMVAALVAGAVVYMRIFDRDLSPLIVPGTGRIEQLLTFAAGMSVYVAITTYASHTIGQLRTQASDALRMGQYILEERIGAGAMGEVWRAQHALLQRPTAVKLIQGDVNEELATRFEREVRSAARLTHANSVAIYDFGVADGGRLFYAMELLEGKTLEQMVELAGPMPAERVVHLLDQVLGALEEAHGMGIVHRDVKPANVMVVKNGAEHDFVKLVDFGLVHLLKKSDQSLALTSKGTVAGTPLFMAPETITGDAAPDGRTDVYSLGAVGYYLLTGEPPFVGANATVVMLDHLKKAPVPPSERSELAVPADVEAAILRALAKAPADRFATAAEMRAALEACASAGRWKEEDAAAWWRTYAPDATRRAA